MIWLRKLYDRIHCDIGEVHATRTGSSTCDIGEVTVWQVPVFVIYGMYRSTRDKYL